MTRIGNTFALAAAVLSFAELTSASDSPSKSPTKGPTKSPSTSPSVSPTQYAGTGEWYADTAGSNLCTKDCATGGSDAECTGVNHDTATWLTDTYADAETCCRQKYSYLDSSYCADRSKVTPTGTNKYYADLSSSSCQVDDDPSLSKVFHSGELYADAAACCTGALGWISSLYCESRSEGGAGYHNKWYVDYSDMVCKQDCATSGGAHCEPVTDTSSSNTLFDSAAACCSGKLGWMDQSLCETVSSSGTAATYTGTDKFYADYQSSPARCAKDCDTSSDPTCGSIQTNTAGIQFFDTAASCCSSKFGFMDNDLCVALTTGAHTNKWYVDYQSNSCVQDCATATNSPCAGTPSDLSMALFDTAASCCSNKLGWVSSATCESISATGAAAATGTLKYYADYSSGTCKKDCAAANTSPECGGILTNTAGESLFDTSAACCAGKFGWIDTDLCAAMAVGGYTNKFYVDYADKACKQDCAAASNTNCAGNPGDKSTEMFSTAAACCSSKLSYINSAQCEAKSTTGSAASATGSNKWYVDWSISKCVKDCATGSDSECGGLAEDYESNQGLYSSWSQCCNTRLSWVRDADCHL